MVICLANTGVVIRHFPLTSRHTSIMVSLKKLLCVLMTNEEISHYTASKVMETPEVCGRLCIWKHEERSISTLYTSDLTSTKTTQRSLHIFRKKPQLI